MRCSPPGCFVGTELWLQRQLCGPRAADLVQRINLEARSGAIDAGALRSYLELQLLFHIMATLAFLCRSGSDTTPR